MTTSQLIRNNSQSSISSREEENIINERTSLIKNNKKFKKHHNLIGLSPIKFRLICFSLWCGTFLVAFDSTLVSTLLSEIGSEFKSSTQISWIGTSYLLSVCCFTPIYGRLSDLIGRRNSHLTGMFFFTIGTFLCGFSPSIWSLIISRGIAGIGGGGVQSVSVILMTDLVDLRHRGIYQGYVNILFGTGAALGGPVGGWISDHFGWRVAFTAQVPLLLITAGCIYTFVNFPQASSIENGSRWKKQLGRIDWLGSLTLALGVGTLLLSMSIKTSTTKSNGKDYKFSDPIIFGLLMISVIILCLFVLIEGYYSKEPILPLKLLIRRTPLSIAISSFTMVLGQYSILYNLPLFFTIVQSKSSSSAGAHLLPNSILIGIGSLFAGWRMRHTGKYWLLSVGCSSLMVISSIGMLFWKRLSPNWLTWIAQAPGGFGYAGVLTTSLVALMTHITRRDRSETAVATSMSYLFRTVGQVLGVAISAAIVQHVVQKDLDRDIVGPGASQIIYQIRHSTSSIPHLSPKYKDAAINAYEHALHLVFVFNLIVSILTVLSLAMVKEEEMVAPPPPQVEEQEEEQV
uniref:Multidrug resistance protein fnx1 n=1 Tax=Kwoniella pini CBS 10737 TaxID=1296096 RepID=A0A1B9I9T9_9TREE|nr:multidrug resistance protein fnx1 [Kwoniella pini CBS 10737]OCF52388.1 multidrug resistance protein fnx1 [Kwoniella pini CBS 10737]